MNELKFWKDITEHASNGFIYRGLYFYIRNFSRGANLNTLANIVSMILVLFPAVAKIDLDIAKVVSVLRLAWR